MRRQPRHARRAFPIALVLTLVLALLPSRWLRLPVPWLGALELADVADIVKVPLMPIQDAGRWAARRLRPEDVAPQDQPSDTEVAELDELRRRYRAALLRINELENQLESIRQLPIARFGVPVRPVPNVRVTARNPKSPSRAAELNHGRGHGVEEDAIAVFNGVYLVGRVTEVAQLRSVLLPITSPSSGLLGARVVRANQQESVGLSPVIQLQPVGDGTFAADAPQAASIREGDLVILDDSDQVSEWPWPETAQAMIIGRVESIRRKDDNPVRNTLTVKPPYQLYELSEVTLVVEDRAAGEDLVRSGPS